MPVFSWICRTAVIVTRSVSLEVACFGSPVGTAGCSPGRKPRENRRNSHSSPVGAAGNGAFVFLPPLRGSEGCVCSKTRSSRPGLHPIAAPRLHSATSKLALRVTSYVRPVTFESVCSDGLGKPSYAGFGERIPSRILSHDSSTIRKQRIQP